MGRRLVFYRYGTSEHRAEDFAADIGVAGVVVGHDTLRRRDDGDTEAVVDARQVLHRGVDAAAGLGDALDLADHRLAVEIFQLDVELGAAFAFGYRVTADIALGLEHFEHALAQFRARAADLSLVAHLRIADAGQQIAERIVHCHGCDPPLTSSTSRDPGSGLWNRDPAARCATVCAYDSSRAAGRSSRSGCGCGWPRNCAAFRQASAWRRNAPRRAWTCRAQSL